MTKTKKCFLQTPPNPNFSIFNLPLYENGNLDLSELGVLATLLFLPDNWTFSIEALANLFSDDAAETAAVINRLEEKGYLNIDGETVYIFDKPCMKGGQM